VLSLFRTFNLRYLSKHKLRTATILFGVALGVMMMVSTLLVNQSILRSYRSLIDTVAGKTALQVLPSTDSGLPVSVIDEVAEAKGVKAVVPVVQKNAFVSLGAKQVGALLVYGIDPEIDMAARDYEFVSGRQVKASEDGAVVVTKVWAKEHSVKIGDHIGIIGVNGIKSLKVSGLLADKGPGRANMGQFAVTDIGVARDLFNRAGKVDHIDVVLADGEKPKTVQNRIKDALDARAEVEIPSTRGSEVQKSLDSMSVFLTLAGMLAVFIGAFIIFNNLEMSVEERRFGISTLRALGLDRKKIFGLIVAEAVFLGFIGSIVGVALGALLASAMSDKIAGIAVLEVTLKVTDLGLTPQILLAGFFLGLIVSVVASIGPALRMLKVTPLEALKPFETAWAPEYSAWKLIASILVFLIGIGLIVSLFTVPGMGGKAYEDSQQFTNFLLASTFFIFLGSVLLMPHILSIPIGGGRSSSFILRMALDNLRRVPGRTAATVTGMMIAVAMMVMIAGMLNSTKLYAYDYFDRALGWDIIVHNGFFSGSANVPLEEGLVKEVAKVDGVKYADARRFPYIKFHGYNTMLNVLEMDRLFEISTLEPKDGNYEQMQRDLKRGGTVAVSALLANKFGYKKGDIITLNSPAGKVRLKIVGILNDMTVDPGYLYIDRRDYKKYWNDDSVDALAVKVAEGTSVDEVSRIIRDRWEDELGIKVTKNEDFKQEILDLTDQQFALTNMVIYIAILVAVFGIMNSALISILQRKRELGIVRALGARQRQVKNLILNESVIMGFIGATFGGFLGIILGLLTVSVQRSVLDIPLKYYIPWETVIGGFVIALGLTALGSIIPARAALKTEIIEGIKYE